MANNFEMIAKTFQGLEEVLAKELQDLGAEQVETITRGVRFWGDREMLYKANFKCRTALRILKPFYKFEAKDTDEVYNVVKAFDWSQYLSVKKTFAIDAVVYSETFRHSKFLAYKVKDAIADHFREKYGERPSVRITNPDVQLSIHVNQETCTLSLDSSGDPLYLRGYKVEQTEAPINEVLAAGMLKLAGWDGTTDFMDPMCGSGTIAIEAALMALNIAPGIYRKSFAFEKWADFDQSIMDKLYEDDSEEREFSHKIYASDISSAALRVCEENVKRAGMSKYIEISHTPFQSVDRPDEPTMIMFNPPYGERIKPASLATLYEEIGAKLKRDFTDMSAWIITVPCESTDRIGLRPSLKYHLLNGAIECEFRKYDMFKGRRDDFLRERADKQEEFEKKREDEGELGEHKGVYMLPAQDRWKRESMSEDELSEYRARRHEAFEKRQANIAEARREYNERRFRGDRSNRSEGENGEERRDRRPYRNDDDKDRRDFRKRDDRDGERRREERRGFERRDDRRGERSGGRSYERRDGERRDSDRGGRRSFSGDRRSNYGEQDRRDNRRVYDRRDRNELGDRDSRRSYDRRRDDSDRSNNQEKKYVGGNYFDPTAE